ncbi:unnamed protein product [Arctia plantaginis]|uniref:Thyroglobulin type-1 domain-containing protein n=1 Tax=Arctia plantaginis TaxID=874455 RepID=A0A8S1AAY2_ARCPL|nr:unnamed protein product [Arctia plantaginis]
MADLKCLAFVSLLYLFNLVKSSSLCTEEFCSAFISETGCATPAAHCNINNATHFGVRMPSPTVCNCCEFCLPLFAEGQTCTLGGPGMGTAIGRCGDGLTCALNTTDGVTRCVRMSSPCHTLQDQYDQLEAEGTLGMLVIRPMCDGRGKHGPVQCVNTQTCFCQSEEGERIFGEASYLGPSTLRNMQCACSRLHENIEKNISPGMTAPVVGPRCTIDGNFNPVQCLNRTCHCVNPVTGIIITEIKSINLDTHPITELPCYDPLLDNYWQNSRGDPPFKYTTTCIQNRDERVNAVLQSIEDGFNVDFGGGFTRCYPDGTYGRLGQTMTGSIICLDDRGRRIRNFEAKPGTEDFHNTDCKCAMTSYLMGAAHEKPVCCKNGNFRSIQCRRGLCYCVDSDGRQTTKENSDVTRLSCFTPDWRDC